MSVLGESASGSGEKRIGPALRRDLEVSHQRRDGLDRAVIKDPLTLRFFEMGSEDYQLATRINLGATAREIAATWRRELPALCRARGDVELERRAVRLCSELRHLGLCESPAQTNSTSVRMKWSAWFVRLARRISAPLFLRFRMGDPDAFLEVVVRALRPLFSRTACGVAALFVAVTLVAAIAHAGEMEMHTEWFLVWQHALALYLGILALKVIHEAGHALVCKALGGQVPEVGAQLLAFHPTFFVDVSDTWMWPQRRRRIAVAAAGFGAEMIVAALLFWLWCLLAPGFARDLCLNLMFVASVSAVFFNANPLMRYDGYHILADLWREPHLRKHAFATLTDALRRVIFGSRLVPRAVTPRRGRLMLYAIASTVYLVWIVCAVAGFLERALAPLGLEGAGKVLIAAWLIGMLVPIVGFFRTLLVDLLRLDAARRPRPLFAAAAVVVLLGAAAFVPVPIRVERACVVAVPSTGVLRASEPGVVVEMLVREGERVQRGQHLAGIENRSLTLAQDRTALEVGQTRIALFSAAGESRAVEVEQHLRHFNKARANSEQAARRTESLLLTSPCDGLVLTRQTERRQGQRVRAGDEVLSIGGPELRECLLPLSEKEARRIHEGAVLALRLRAAPGTTYSGRISAPPLRIKGDDLPPALTALAGGEIAVDATGKVFSSEVTHVARFTIETAEMLARPGSTGRVRLDCGQQSAWRWLLETALDAIHLDHRV